MYKHIKVKNHKGIKSVYLNNLKGINILFGKNNSGKTSIMEGLCSSCCGFTGKPVESEGRLMDLFRQDAEKYFNNYSKKAAAAFHSYLESLEEQETIWYSGDIDEITQTCIADLSETKDLQNIDTMFDLESLLKTWFDDSESASSSILIPPKRKLESKVTVDLNQEISNFGSGIANHLFNLKNRSVDTDENFTFKRINSAFTEISDYEFDIIPAEENCIQIVFKRIDEEQWIPAVDSGLGLADLLILITFAVGTEHSVICMEEPESLLHPEIQKRFLNFLKGVKNKQFFISTHSSIFLNPSIVDSITYVQYKDREVMATDETESSRILYNLGYSISDHLIADTVILVEHSSAVPVLSTIFSWIGIDKHHNINFFPLSGDVRAYLDLSIFSGRQNVAALTYTRSDTEVATARFYNNCDKLNIKVHRLERASIENYFTLPALRAVFEDAIPADIDFIDGRISVDAQIGFSLQHRSVKTHNSQIIQEMTLNDLLGTDLLEFCELIQSSLQRTAGHRGRLTILKEKSRDLISCV